MPFDAEPIEKRVATGLAKLGLAIKAQSWRGAGAASLTPTQGQAL
ncbi:MAG: MarR family transcriptional regulator, partial [Alphaproteobacteria bacterium]|nr:MarR family transcriptional regulator [Alphaproteobacteria bacterium]